MAVGTVRWQTLMLICPIVLSMFFDSLSPFALCYKFFDILEPLAFSFDHL
jgi:hypothetical protein